MEAECGDRKAGAKAAQSGETRETGHRRRAPGVAAEAAGVAAGMVVPRRRSTARSAAVTLRCGVLPYLGGGRCGPGLGAGVVTAGLRAQEGAQDGVRVFEHGFPRSVRRTSGAGCGVPAGGGGWPGRSAAKDDGARRVPGGRWRECGRGAPGDRGSGRPRPARGPRCRAPGRGRAAGGAGGCPQGGVEQVVLGRRTAAGVAGHRGGRPGLCLCVRAGYEQGEQQHQYARPGASAGGGRRRTGAAR
jgi:hypothetical protein